MQLFCLWLCFRLLLSGIHITEGPSSLPEWITSVSEAGGGAGQPYPHSEGCLFPCKMTLNTNKYKDGILKLPNPTWSFFPHIPFPTSHMTFCAILSTSSDRKGPHESMTGSTAFRWFLSWGVSGFPLVVKWMTGDTFHLIVRLIRQTWLTWHLGQTIVG